MSTVTCGVGVAAIHSEIKSAAVIDAAPGEIVAVRVEIPSDRARLWLGGAVCCGARQDRVK